MAGRFFCLEFSTTEWPGFKEAYDLYSQQAGAEDRQGDRGGRGQLSLPRRIDPALPDHARIRANDPGGGSFSQTKGRGRSWAGWSRSTPAGRFDQAPPPISGGCSNGAARSRSTALCAGSSAIPTPPLPVRRLAKIARFGTFQPAEPDYSSAFKAIGPAAIKLGQSLATRPDLVGDVAARNLLTLQDSLPPVPFEAIRAEIEGQLRPAARRAVSRASIPSRSARPRSRRVHRAVTTDGRTSRGQGAAPRHPPPPSRATSRPMNGPPPISRRSAARPCGCARG